MGLNLLISCQCFRLIRLNLTVWKFHDFSINQILREINFSDSKSEKSAVLTHLKALNFDFYVCIFAISEQS